MGKYRRSRLVLSSQRADCPLEVVTRGASTAKEEAPKTSALNLPVERVRESLGGNAKTTAGLLRLGKAAGVTTLGRIPATVQETQE